MSDDAPTLGDAPVRRALATAFPGLHVGRVRFLGAGWDSSAWLIDEELVFRFPRRAEVADWLRRETALLPALAPALPAPIPRFTHIAPAGAPDDPALPFVGYPILRGTPLDDTPELLRPDAPIVAGMGAFLAALHAFPVAEAIARGVPARDWGDWLAWWRGWVARLLDEGSRHLPLPTYAWAIALLADFLAELGRAERRVALIHHDLALEHILVAPGGALAGVIDWGDVALGDPALDFAGLIAGGCPPATFAATLRAYGGAPDGRFATRAAWYARLGPFHTLYFGLHTGDPAMIARGVGEVEALRGERTSPPGPLP